MLSWSEGNNRVIDRFILGPNIMRGFEPGGIGPRDHANGDALGGNMFVTARFEAEFPLGLPEEYGIRGAVFYDVGNRWRKRLVPSRSGCFDPVGYADWSAAVQLYRCDQERGL